MAFDRAQPAARMTGAPWSKSLASPPVSPLVLMFSFVALSGPAPAAAAAPSPSNGDVRLGQELFQHRCALCHPSQPGAPGAAGPNLVGVVGRRAGTSAFAGYTEALRRSDIRWTAQELDRYLVNPTERVPGTSMVIRVPEETERRDILAYLESLKGPSRPAPKSKQGAAP
jgi:cytochrome c